jgi:hypothetical protein
MTGVLRGAGLRAAGDASGLLRNSRPCSNWSPIGSR